MPTTGQVRSQRDRNVVPDDEQPNIESTVDECPFDPSNLAHMRADRSALDD